MADATIHIWKDGKMLMAMPSDYSYEQMEEMREQFHRFVKEFDMTGASYVFGAEIVVHDWALAGGGLPATKAR